jgi:hypothetical protein
MNVESIDSADYTLRLKRRKGEFRGIQAENSQNRTEEPGHHPSSALDSCDKDAYRQRRCPSAV